VWARSTAGTVWYDEAWQPVQPTTDTPVNCAADPYGFNDGFRVLAFVLDTQLPAWRNAVPLSPFEAALGSARVRSRFDYYLDKPVVFTIEEPDGTSVARVNRQYAACAWLMSPMLAVALPFVGLALAVAFAVLQVILAAGVRALVAVAVLVPPLAILLQVEDDDPDLPPSPPPQSQQQQQPTASP